MLRVSHEKQSAKIVWSCQYPRLCTDCTILKKFRYIACYHPADKQQNPTSQRLLRNGVFYIHRV